MWRSAIELGSSMRVAALDPRPGLGAIIAAAFLSLASRLAPTAGTCRHAARQARGSPLPSRKGVPAQHKTSAVKPLPCSLETSRRPQKTGCEGRQYNFGSEPTRSTTRSATTPITASTVINMESSPDLVANW